jgi:hypothetical protein
MVHTSSINHSGRATGLALRMAASPEETKQLVKPYESLLDWAMQHRITVTVGIAAPWVTAFIKWCLGMPPSI